MQSSDQAEELELDPLDALQLILNLAESEATRRQVLPLQNSHSQDTCVWLAAHDIHYPPVLPLPHLSSVSGLLLKIEPASSWHCLV